MGNDSDHQTPSALKMVLTCGVISLLLYLSGIFVWLTPLPILYVFKKGRRVQGLLAVAVALLGLLFLYQVLIPFVAAKWGEPKVFEIFFWAPGVVAGDNYDASYFSTFGIPYYAFFAFAGILLGEFESRAYGVTRLMSQTVVILMLAFVAWIFWYSQGHFLELVHELENYFISLMQALTKAPEGNEEVKTQLALLKPHIPQMAYYAVHLLPAMAINSVIFILWLNIVVARKFFYKDLYFPALGPLGQWRFPFLGVWLVIGSAFLLLLDIYWLHIEGLKLFAVNVFLIFGFIYFFQGLAIVVFYTVRWSLSSLVKMMLYLLLLLFFQPVSLLLVAFGFFDSWFDFRKLKGV